MAKKSMILKQQRPAKFSTPPLPTAARYADAPTPTCVTTASAVSASVSWLIRARFPESKRLLGNFPPYIVSVGRCIPIQLPSAHIV